MNFLLDHKNFAQGYLEWIQQNDVNLTNYAATPGTHRISPSDIKVYANVFKEILKEKISYVFIIILS